MPSVSEKSDKKAVMETVDSLLKESILLIEKKMRNLQKRKGKLDGYRNDLAKGKELIADQLKAVQKYDEVTQMLEFSNDLMKLLSLIVNKRNKEVKKQSKREHHDKQIEDLRQIRRIFTVQNILLRFNIDSVRTDFIEGINGAVKLSQEQVELIYQFSRLILFFNFPHDINAISEFYEEEDDDEVNNDLILQTCLDVETKNISDNENHKVLSSPQAMNTIIFNSPSVYQSNLPENLVSTKNSFSYLIDPQANIEIAGTHAFIATPSHNMTFTTQIQGDNNIANKFSSEACLQSIPSHVVTSFAKNIQGFTPVSSTILPTASSNDNFIRPLETLPNTCIPIPPLVQSTMEMPSSNFQSHSVSAIPIITSLGTNNAFISTSNTIHPLNVAVSSPTLNSKTVIHKSESNQMFQKNVENETPSITVDKWQPDAPAANFNRSTTSQNKNNYESRGFHSGYSRGRSTVSGKRGNRGSLSSRGRVQRSESENLFNNSAVDRQRGGGSGRVSNPRNRSSKPAMHKD